MLLSELWDLCEQDRKIEGYSPGTLKGYRLQVSLLTQYIGDVEAEEVTAEILKAYLAEQDHLKPSSLAFRVRVLQSVFGWAHREGYIPENPAAKLKEPKQGKRIPKALSEEDTELLREGCKTPLEHVLVEFLYSTGCRISELQKLNKADINWENRSTVVLGKGDKEREVYFSVRCLIWLRRYLKERTDTDTALIVTERKPHRMSISQIRYVIKRVAKRANVGANVYPHKLRHSYATHLLNNGAPMEAIQSFLGHAKIETTKVYAALSGARRREIYRKYF